MNFNETDLEARCLEWFRATGWETLYGPIEQCW